MSQSPQVQPCLLYTSCYYCSSSFQSFTGSMAVNSGVEHADAARAERAILKELADLCDGPITDEEFEDCRRGLLSGMQGRCV